MASDLVTIMFTLISVNAVIGVVSFAIGRPYPLVLKIFIAIDLIVSFSFIAYYLYLCFINEVYPKKSESPLHINTFDEYFFDYEYRRYNQSDPLSFEHAMNTSLY